MPLASFTRAGLEQRAADQLNTALAALSNLATLRSRITAELAAGTLDTAEFYQGDVEDKANIVGALDEAYAIWQWVTGGGNVAAPAGDPLAYGRFLLS